VKRKTQGSIQGYGRERKWEIENGRARKVRVHVYACTEDSFCRVATNGEQATEQKPKKNTISFAKKKGAFLACFGSKVPTNLFIFLVIYVRQFFNKIFCQFDYIK